LPKTVHILNGDSTAYGLEKGAIEGDIIVWREMLADGALDYEVGSDAFWTLRYDFFEKEFDVDRIEYYDTTINELIKIEDLSNYNEVVLWFEFDLFCQVNLMALCAYLFKHFRKSIAYYLICTGKEKGKDRLQSLSDYAPSAYKNLLENRIKITRHDLVFAKECWEKYVTNDINELKAFNYAKNRKFNYFQLAMNQHLKRFAGTNGINQIDMKILESIQSNNLTKKAIIRELLIWQQKETVYGFGDLQYSNYLDKLHPYYEINNDCYVLNQKGIDTLTN